MPLTIRVFRFTGFSFPVFSHSRHERNVECGHEIGGSRWTNPVIPIQRSSVQHRSRSSTGRRVRGVDCIIIVKRIRDVDCDERTGGAGNLNEELAIDLLPSRLQLIAARNQFEVTRVTGTKGHCTHKAAGTRLTERRTARKLDGRVKGRDRSTRSPTNGGHQDNPVEFKTLGDGRERSTPRARGSLAVLQEVPKLPPVDDVRDISATNTLENATDVEHCLPCRSDEPVPAVDSLVLSADPLGGLL
jgi:hypothetical protein